MSTCFFDIFSLNGSTNKSFLFYIKPATGRNLDEMRLPIMQEKRKQKTPKMRPNGKQSNLLNQRWCHAVSPSNRRIEELREAEQSLKLRSENNDTVFREKSEGISSSLANLRTKRAALSKTEMILNSLTTKLEELARSTREEEALRAVVPAGSGR